MIQWIICNAKQYYLSWLYAVSGVQRKNSLSPAGNERGSSPTIQIAQQNRSTGEPAPTGLSSVAIPITEEK